MTTHKTGSATGAKAKFSRDLWLCTKKELIQEIEEYTKEFGEFDADSFLEIKFHLVKGDATQKHRAYISHLSKRRPRVLTTTKGDPEIYSDDTTSVVVYKLSEFLRTSHQFYAMSQKSPVWKYDGGQGIWSRDGENFIHSSVAEMLDDNFKTHIANEVEASIRYRSYDASVTLGGPAQKIVVANGVYDLENNSFSTDHQSEEYHLSVIPVTYDPDADCPLFKKFLIEVIDHPDDREAIIEFFGYCLYKKYEYSTILMLLGEGANGKSVLLSVLKAFLGTENVCSATLQQLAEQRFAIAQLFGKLANVAGDIPSRPLSYTGVLKMLTGGDLVNAEFKNRDAFDFENHAKLIFSANQLPASYDNTDAFHRRMRVIVFPHTFPATDPKTDPHLATKLTVPEELSGILNLAIDGLMRLRSQGHLTGDKSIEEKRVDWVRRSDSVKYMTLMFLEHDTNAPNIPKKDLYDLYLQMCHGLGMTPVADVTFAKRLRRIVSWISEGQQRTGDQRVRVWRGVGIKYEELDAALSGTGGTGDTGYRGASIITGKELYKQEKIEECIIEGEGEKTRATCATRDRGFQLMVARLRELWKSCGLDLTDILLEKDLRELPEAHYPHEMLGECRRARLVDEKKVGQWSLTDLAISELGVGSVGSSDDEGTHSARAETQKPPLTEDVLIVLLTDRSWTSSALRDEVVTHGYQREEFDPIFDRLKEHPNMVKRGQTPVYWKWKK